MRRELHVSACNFLTLNKRSRNEKKASTPLDGVRNEDAAVSLAENCRKKKEWLESRLCEVIQSVDLLASTRASFSFFFATLIWLEIRLRTVLRTGPGSAGSVLSRGPNGLETRGSWGQWMRRTCGRDDGAAGFSSLRASSQKLFRAPGERLCGNVHLLVAVVASSSASSNLTNSALLLLYFTRCRRFTSRYEGVSACQHLPFWNLGSLRRFFLVRHKS